MDEIWYSVSWVQLIRDPDGSVMKRKHRYNLWTREGAYRLYKNLEEHQAAGKCEAIYIERKFFDKKK